MKIDKDDFGKYRNDYLNGFGIIVHKIKKISSSYLFFTPYD